MVVGAGESGRCAHPFATDSWLRAEDGTWSEAPFQPLFCAGGNAAVAAAGGLAVVVGAGNGDVAFGWSSPDGLHWTDHSAGFPVGLPFEVIATPGEFLAFGVGPDGAWVEGSRDGANWTPPSSLPGPAEARPVGAAVLSDRIVVVLGHPSGAVGLVSSVDGLTWTTEPVPGLVSGELIRVEAIDGGLVAIGGDEEGPTLRVSADGHTWRDVSLPQELTKESSVTDVAVGRGHAILIATRGSEAGTTEPAAWMGPASLLAP